MYLKNIDLVSFDHLLVDSYLYKLVIKKQSLFSRDYIRKINCHWSITLPCTMEEFYNRRAAQTKHKWKQNIRKLEKTFDVKYIYFNDENNIELLLKDAEEVAKHTYQRGLMVGYDRSQENENRIKLMARKGWLRAYIMYLNGIPCSFGIGTLYKNTLYYNFIGYNPQYNKYRLGLITSLKFIESLIAEKVNKLDFGFGDADYKELFGDKNEIESSISMFSTSIKGVMINILRTAIFGSSILAIKMLEKMNILNKIKKYWRKQVIPKNEL